MTICDNCNKDVHQTHVIHLSFCDDCWPKREAEFEDKCIMITNAGACWVIGCGKPVHGVQGFPYVAELCEEHFRTRDFKKEDTANPSWLKDHPEYLENRKRK